MLRLRLELAGDGYASAATRLWGHRRLTAIFPHYLFRIHSIIRASVPVMEAACEVARSRAADDPAAAALASYLEQHIPEERHHDEWLLDDLEVLGISRAAVGVRIPSPTVAALVGSQYYWIRHYHPIAVMGYIAVLEGNPPTEEFAAGLIARTGLPPRAFRTIIKHARLDPHHRDDLNDALDAMPLAPEHEELVTVSALETQALLGESIEELL
jgi:hypothetical protein